MFVALAGRRGDHHLRDANIRVRLRRARVAQHRQLHAVVEFERSRDWGRAKVLQKQDTGSTGR